MTDNSPYGMRPSDYGIPAPDPADYWDKPCRGCSDTGRTNKECAAEVAENLGITVEEAMRQFGPATQINVSQVSTKWSQGEQKAGIDGQQ